LKHFIRRCTKNKPHEFVAQFVVSAAEGLVFFFLDAEEANLQQNEKHKLALVLVLEGNVATKQLEELSVWLGGETKWIWYARAQGVNQ
jgi:hypothetical protein